MYVAFAVLVAVAAVYFIVKRYRDANKEETPKIITGGGAPRDPNDPPVDRP